MRTPNGAPPRASFGSKPEQEVIVRYRMRVGGVVLSVAAIATFAAGCGGSDSTNDTSNSSGQNGFQAYLSCLSQNGVTINMPSGGPGMGNGGANGTPGAFPSDRPSGQPSGQPSTRPSGGANGGQGGGFGGGNGLFGTSAPDGVDQATWEKAQKACESVKPSSGPGMGNGGQGGNNSALTAYRNCLTSHGVSASADPNSLDSTDSTVSAALKACAALKPAQATPSASS